MDVSDPDGGSLTVTYTIGGTASNGVDYAAIPNWIPIPAGVRTVEVPVAPIDDRLVEGAETFTIALANPSGGVPLAGYSVLRSTDGTACGCSRRRTACS